jgi:hypothetical protein
MKNLKGKKNLVGCEIGVKSGRHARLMLNKLDISKLYLIDPYDFFPEKFVFQKEYGKKRTKKGSYESCKKQLSPWNEKIQFILKLSEEAHEHIKDGELDFVYIDGNHEKEFVSKDIELYWPKLKIGGLMAGHDFMAPRWQGVIDAVNEFFGDNYMTGQTVEKKFNNVEWWVWKQSS